MNPLIMDIHNNPVMDSRNSWKYIVIHNCIMDTYKLIMDIINAWCVA